VDKKLNKKEIVEQVDAIGKLIFQHWYKGDLVYKNDGYTVTIRPDYRDQCEATETLESLLQSEDYDNVNVFKGKEKPWEWDWYKKGDNF